MLPTVDGAQPNAAAQQNGKQATAASSSSLAQEEADFFNQTIPTEAEKAKLTKDSIMALYAKNNPSPFIQAAATAAAAPPQQQSQAVQPPQQLFGGGCSVPLAGPMMQYAGMNMGQQMQQPVAAASVPAQFGSMQGFGQPPQVGGAFMNGFGQPQPTAGPTFPVMGQSGFGNNNQALLNQTNPMMAMKQGFGILPQQQQLQQPQQSQQQQVHFPQMMGQMQQFPGMMLMGGGAGGGVGAGAMTMPPSSQPTLAQGPGQFGTPAMMAPNGQSFAAQNPAGNMQQQFGALNLGNVWQ